MSNYCPNCKTMVASDLVNCPLCGKFIEGNSGEKLATSYYDTRLIERNTHLKVINILNRLLIVIVSMALLVNLFVNFYTRNWGINAYWSLYVFVGSAILHYNVLRPVMLRRFKWKEVASLIFFHTILICLIDFLDGFDVNWSVEYILPATISAVCIGFSIYALASRRADIANIGLLQILLIIVGAIYCLVFTLLDMFKVINISILPNFITLFILIFMFLVCFLIKYRRYGYEIKKKFHF